VFRVKFSEGQTWLLLLTVHARQERDAVVTLASQSFNMGARSLGIMLTSCSMSVSIICLLYSL
jgi:hypothetical protein